MSSSRLVLWSNWTAFTVEPCLACIWGLWFLTFIIGKGEVKFEAIKTYGGSGCMNPRSLAVSISWRWVISFTLRQFIPVERTCGTHRVGDPMDHRTCLDAVGRNKILSTTGHELLPFGRPVRTQSMHQMLFSVPFKWKQLCTLFLFKNAVWTSLRGRGREPLSSEARCSLQPFLLYTSSELHRPNGQHFQIERCHVVSTTRPHGR
jgi:hypothetical protein